ncbi:MAG: permease [Eubacteriales bacterium]|nr:permease [Eubacteriales bacterium]
MTLAQIANSITSNLGLDINSALGGSVSFFIEDSVKIFLLIYVMLFVVALFRYQLSPEKIKSYLQGKSLWWGYFLAVFLGVVTPFCSCSSIPLFIGFIAAGIPFGITMTFLISSPLISEVATAMLLTMPEAGWRAALVYITAGSIISVLGGFLCDKFHLEKFRRKQSFDNHDFHRHGDENLIKSTFTYAHTYAGDTVKEIAPYVFVGLAAGAFMHGYIPAEFFGKYLGQSNPFAVPLAALAGIPVYANHNSVLPIVQVLLMKQVPLGTTLVMLMSITAISLPEMIMLNKVLTWKMLAIFTVYLFVSFVIVGYVLNYVM